MALDGTVAFADRMRSSPQILPSDALMYHDLLGLPAARSRHGEPRHRKTYDQDLPVHANATAPARLPLTRCALLTEEIKALDGEIGSISTAARP
ncbi:hypothetical protein FDG2_1725 [Candidatus Protofrankia californiensis]|uniref:Uncharacterized protein n=1 Tax=Candidatus Protofrankia californiensis TaxID=1839754 RepID=A0A1C3NWA2_9ACTN|nr:hypothetical protein FDG2_1725 [Candidatus Protofrankia californiensis]